MRSSHGFSLVELSIVLVILGLLVGGILAGQSLIRASELRAVGTEYNRYATATRAFQDKYRALPGDIGNATSFWGAATYCPGTSAQGSTDQTTCNGDGNGLLGVPATSTEWFRFWQHLSNAGLVEGTYSGVSGSISNTYTGIPGNVPASKLSGGYWMAAWWGYTGVGDTTRFVGAKGNLFGFGGLATNNDPNAPLLTPPEMWNIDTKLDDGKPATGKVIIRYWAICTDATDNTQLEANYLLSFTTPACNAIFTKGVF